MPAGVSVGVVSGAVHLVPYALLAALSPLAFAATVTVLRTGRLKALGFGCGVVLGQLVACTVLVAIGAVTTPHRAKAYPTFAALLEVGLGLALVCFAIVVHRRPEIANRSSSGRSEAALERLRRVRVLTAWVVGFLLGIGGPKRLVLTGLASASITATGVTGSNEALLVGWYTLLATVLVWLPVLGYLLLGNWAVVRLDAALEWLGVHRRTATVYVLAVTGVVLLVDGLILL
jgi:Sap, sulfolipid-1-addressing protein